MDVIPSAPTHETEPQTRIYPNLSENFAHAETQTTPTNSQSFRLENVSKIQKQISDEVEHYRVVAKKYKKAAKVVHYAVFTLGAATTAISTVAVVIATTGVGVIVGAPLSGVAALSGLTSSVLMFVSKKFEKRINKHESIHSLAVAKHNSIRNYVSEALNNNIVSDSEFKKIIGEMDSYNALKKEMRDSFNKKVRAAQEVDMEKLRRDVEKNVRNELSKKLSRKLSTLRKASE